MGEINSTNEFSKQLLDEPGYLDGVVVLAQSQTAGKGRFLRRWISPPGGIYMSLILQERNFNNLMMIAPLSIIKTIKYINKLDCWIKWPNDVVYNSKKLSGILIEIYKKHVILGIGVNLNTAIEDLPPGSTSILEETGEACRKEKWLDYFWNIFKNYLENSQDGEVVQEYKDLSMLTGKFIHIRTLQGTMKGLVVDFERDGTLVLRNPWGMYERINSAQVVKVE